LLVKDRKLDEANALQREVLPLARSVGGLYGVPGLKAALDLMGYTGGVPRPPLRAVSPKISELISDQLDVLGVISSTLR
jgi:4-hydroxy-2-oxoglutarate aldolase